MCTVPGPLSTSAAHLLRSLECLGQTAERARRSCLLVAQRLLAAGLLDMPGVQVMCRSRAVGREACGRSSNELHLQVFYELLLLHAPACREQTRDVVRRRMHAPYGSARWPRSGQSSWDLRRGVLAAAVSRDQRLPVSPADAQQGYMVSMKASSLQAVGPNSLHSMAPQSAHFSPAPHRDVGVLTSCWPGKLLCQSRAASRQRWIRHLDMKTSRHELCGSICVTATQCCWQASGCHVCSLSP